MRAAREGRRAHPAQAWPGRGAERRTGDGARRRAPPHWYGPRQPPRCPTWTTRGGQGPAARWDDRRRARRGSRVLPGGEQHAEGDHARGSALFNRPLGAELMGPFVELEHQHGLRGVLRRGNVLVRLELDVTASRHVVEREADE